MRIKLEPIDAVKPHPSNPRRDHDVQAIANSIRAFGFRQPLVVYDGDGHLMVGHGRLLAAKELNLDKVPVHHVSAGELTPQQAAAYRLADNRSAEGSTWDDALLLAELEALSERDRELAGFDAAHQEELRWRASYDGMPDVDPAAEWRGMPEFIQGDAGAYRSIAVHFRDQDAVDEFARLLKRPMTSKTRYLWFPEMEVERYADKRWVAEEADSG